MSDQPLAPPTCTHCGREIEDRGTPHMSGWRANWVHIPGGHSVCRPRQAVGSTRAELPAGLEFKTCCGSYVGHYPDCDRTIPDAASQSRTTPDNPGVTSPLQRIADAASQIEAGVRAAAKTAVSSVVKALGATREEFELSGPVAVATPRNAPDVRELVAAAIRTRLCQDIASGRSPLRGEIGAYGAATEYDLADAALAVVDDNLPERAQAAIRALEQQRDVREERLDVIREYVKTSDDDGIRTREQVLRILGPGGEVGP